MRDRRLEGLEKFKQFVAGIHEEVPALSPRESLVWIPLVPRGARAARLESYRSAARSHGNWVSRRRMAWAAVCRGTAGGGTASGGVATRARRARWLRP